MKQRKILKKENTVYFLSLGLPVLLLLGIFIYRGIYPFGENSFMYSDMYHQYVPFLTEFFPRIQFIITTHSAYILNSISNACIYDLEKQVRFADLSSYSADEIAEGYFDAQNYSATIQDKILRYQHLVKQEELSDSEKAERAQLRIELKSANKLLEEDISDEFNRIEEKKDSNG